MATEKPGSPQKPGRFDILNMSPRDIAAEMAREMNVFADAHPPAAQPQGAPERPPEIHRGLGKYADPAERGLNAADLTAPDRLARLRANREAARRIAAVETARAARHAEAIAAARLAQGLPAEDAMEAAADYSAAIAPGERTSPGALLLLRQPSARLMLLASAACGAIFAAGAAAILWPGVEAPRTTAATPAPAQAQAPQTAEPAPTVTVQAQPAPAAPAQSFADFAALPFLDLLDVNLPAAIPLHDAPVTPPAAAEPAPISALISFGISSAQADEAPDAGAILGAGVPVELRNAAEPVVWPIGPVQPGPAAVGPLALFVPEPGPMPQATDGTVEVEQAEPPAVERPATPSPAVPWKVPVKTGENRDGAGVGFGASSPGATAARAVPDQQASAASAPAARNIGNNVTGQSGGATSGPAGGGFGAGLGDKTGVSGDGGAGGSGGPGGAQGGGPNSGGAPGAGGLDPTGGLGGPGTDTPGAGGPGAGGPGGNPGTGSPGAGGPGAGGGPSGPVRDGLNDVVGGLGGALGGLGGALGGPGAGNSNNGGGGGSGGGGGGGGKGANSGGGGNK